MAITVRTAPFVASWYTPVAEKDAEEPARFSLRPLSQQQWLEVVFLDGANTDTDKGLTPRQIELALRYGLVDWENIKDEHGRPVRATRRALEMLPAEYRVELAGEILRRSRLDEDDAKN